MRIPTVGRTPERLLALGILITACACTSAAPSVGSEAAVNTIVAATLRASQPFQSAAAATTPTFSSTPALLTAAAPPLGTRRLNLPHGAATGAVQGHLEPGEAQAFVLQAQVGQPMIVHAVSAGDAITISIRTQGGTSLLAAAEKKAYWQGALPRTEDYVITASAGQVGADFSLIVQLAARIKFKEGATSGTISGTAADGLPIVYSLFAQKDQKVSLGLSASGGKATLGILGWANGQTYLSPESSKTSVSLRVPATQDYLIQVVPKPGTVLRFILSVQIQ